MSSRIDAFSLLSVPPCSFRGTHTTLAKIWLITITCAIITLKYGTLHGTPGVNRMQRALYYVATKE